MAEGSGIMYELAHSLALLAEAGESRADARFLLPSARDSSSLLFGRRTRRRARKEERWQTLRLIDLPPNHRRENKPFAAWEQLRFFSPASSFS